MVYKRLTLKELRELPARVKELVLDAEGEGGLVDVAGELSQIEKEFASARRMAASELESGVQGKVWRIYVPSPKKRSYNTPALINKFSEAWGATIFDTLVALIKMDVVRLSWQWKKLDNAADQYDITLRIAKHEITDGDDADVGVIPDVGYPQYKPVE